VLILLNKQSIYLSKYENETELYKHVWKLKLNSEQFNIKYWSILLRASSIKAGGNSLCLEEKLQILDFHEMRAFYLYLFN
jgi:hypothetical protein